MLDLHEKTKAQLENVFSTYSKKHGVLDESHYDGAKDTLFGWTGQMMAKGSGSHCEIKRLAGAEGVGASCLSSVVSYNPEIAWDRRGGGCSFCFKQPWYQKRAVAQCLKNVSAESVSYY